MNSVTAVLLALALIAVILLIVWLVLRSRSADLPRESTSYGAGAGADGPGASMVDRTPSHHRQEMQAGDATAEDGSGDETSEGRDDLVEQPSNDADAAAEEFVEPGLSELESATPTESGEGALTGTAPTTTAEAFGSAHASADAGAQEAASRETSVLDEPNVDSTPLFRSIREELLGSTSPEESDDEATADPAEEAPVHGVADAQGGASTVDDALTHDVVAEQPEVDLTWSDERRGWDEQAHDESTDVLEDSAGRDGDPVSTESQENVLSETVTEGVVETGAVGAGSLGSAPEEGESLETNEKTSERVAVADSAAPGGEHPPIRRISELQEVVDGGFGIGSARSIDDGAQPVGHPIKANVDTKTYQDLRSPWYDETEPDVWFLDAGFAERAGFRRAE